MCFPTKDRLCYWQFCSFQQLFPVKQTNPLGVRVCQLLFPCCARHIHIYDWICKILLMVYMILLVWYTGLIAFTPNTKPCIACMTLCLVVCVYSPQTAGILYCKITDDCTYKHLCVSIFEGLWLNLKQHTLKTLTLFWLWETCNQLYVLFFLKNLNIWARVRSSLWWCSFLFFSFLEIQN